MDSNKNRLLKLPIFYILRKYIYGLFELLLRRNNRKKRPPDLKAL